MTSVSAPAADRQQPARTNPFLINYFRQAILESNVHEDAYGQKYVDLDDYTLDRNAYSLARDFCSRVDGKLEALEQGFEQVQRARSEALRDPVKARPGAQAAWSESLRHLSDTAKKLHGMLRVILGGLHAEGPPAPGASTRESDPGLEYETSVMGEQILRLDQRIRGFLSGETVKISVEELRGDDILILLSRVQTEAGEMKERLDAPLPLSAQSSKQTGD